MTKGGAVAGRGQAGGTEAGGTEGEPGDPQRCSNLRSLGDGAADRVDGTALRGKGDDASWRKRSTSVANLGRFPPKPRERHVGGISGTLSSALGET